MDDALYDVAYAACYDKEDLRDLAERFEAIGRDWPIDHARRIYRKIGDHQKYLELRSHRMKYGDDYHDLAVFYWKTGDRAKAVEVARKGLKEGVGRMEGLRSFLMERARESKDRSGYLELQFDQATDRLTLKDYQSFKKLCTQKEWDDFEPRVLQRLEKARDAERLKIHMSRKEYDKALSLLKTHRYPDHPYGEDDILKVAGELEPMYPEDILAFYMTGLGNLNRSLDRKAYARKAEAMAKVRHVWVDVLKTPDKWKEFGRKAKEMNVKRPAFQQEFAKVLPDWKVL
jgi:tetratricopeptide (TPR) repeat protein